MSFILGKLPLIGRHLFFVLVSDFIHIGLVNTLKILSFVDVESRRFRQITSGVFPEKNQKL